MADHSDTYRAYYVRNESWWFTPDAPRIGGSTDEVTLGLYAPGGGTSGEMAMRWYNLYNKVLVPCLEVYDDAWSALSTMPDLIDALAKVDNKNITPRQFAAILDLLGFVDTTRRTRDLPRPPEQVQAQPHVGAQTSAGGETVE